MSAINLRVSSNWIQNESAFDIYYTEDLENFTVLKSSGYINYPNTMQVVYITDENKTVMALAQSEHQYYSVMLVYRASYRDNVVVIDRVSSGSSSSPIIEEPLFPDSTCTKTTAHLTPQFLT